MKGDIRISKDEFLKLKEDELRLKMLDKAKAHHWDGYVDALNPCNDDCFQDKCVSLKKTIGAILTIDEQDGPERYAKNMRVTAAKYRREAKTLELKAVTYDEMAERFEDISHSKDKEQEG